MNRDSSQPNKTTLSLEENEGVKIQDKDGNRGDNGEKAGLGSRADTDQSPPETEKTSSVSYEIFKGEFRAEKIKFYLPIKAGACSDQVRSFAWNCEVVL